MLGMYINHLDNRKRALVKIGNEYPEKPYLPAAFPDREQLILIEDLFHGERAGPSFSDVSLDKLSCYPHGNPTPKPTLPDLPVAEDGPPISARRSSSLRLLAAISLSS